MSCMKFVDKKHMGLCSQCGRDSLVKIKEERIVVGAKGKIGSAIADIFDVAVRIDVDTNDLPCSLDGYRIMHFCIPYSDSFENDVVQYIEQYEPQMAIIHTTVPVGTTRIIQKKIQGDVAHVPIHGHHTDGRLSPVSMEKDMFRYIMSVGSCTSPFGWNVCDYLGRFGFKTELYTPETTEFAKLMSTNLIKTVIDSWSWHYNKTAKHDYVSWDAVTRLIENIAQNEPYGYLNRVFQRPGPIDTEISGKHCLSENSKLLW